MSRMNRRRFTLMATGGLASSALVACSGEAVEDDLTPTRIADVEGAPPTLAPNATPFDSGEGDSGGEQASGGGDGAGTITVTGLDTLAYDPSAFEAAPGQTILFVNDGALQHDFNIDELDMHTELLDGGGEEELTVPDDAEVGTEFLYYCSVAGHREGGMEGTMTVVEAGAGGSEEEAIPSEEESTPEESGGGEAVAGAGAGEPITVDALDALQFDPSEIEAAPGQEIHIVNTGALQHDFIVDELGMATDLLNGGEEQTITVPDDAEIGAEYVYYCSVAGHQAAGMEGVMTIIEAGSGGSGEDSTPTDEAEAIPTEAATAAGATPGDEEAAGGGSAEPVTVTCIDIAYEETEITIPADTDVEFNVVNEGVLEHDFNIEDTEFASEMLSGGASDSLTVNLPAGEYVYFCSVAGHREAGMEGTLTVE